MHAQIPLIEPESFSLKATGRACYLAATVAWWCKECAGGKVSS